MIDDNDVTNVDFNIDGEFEELNTKGRSNIIKEHDEDNPLVPYEAKFDSMNREFDETIDQIENPEIRKVLKDSFNDLVARNNINVEFKDFNSIVTHLADYTDKDSEFNRIYVSKMMNAVTDAAKLKSTIALGFLTDKALNLTMKVAQDPNVDSLGTIIASIREIYDWLDKLQGLRDKYYVAGSDKMLKTMSDDHQSGEGAKLSADSINEMVRRINEESKNKGD